MTTSLTLVLVSVLLISLALAIYKPPNWLIQRLQRRYPDVIFTIPTTHKILALTIDDGPSPYTSEINHTLRTHSANATFFLIGSNIPGHEATLRDLLRNCHELANHTMHDEPSINLPSEELPRQMIVVEKLINGLYTSTTSRHQPRYFRPGSGFFNARIRRLVKNLGYKLILGSIYPWDAQISWPRLNAWYVLRSVRPGGVIVIHERKWTVEMLRIVLPELRRRGWRIGTVTELLRHAEGQKSETR